VDARTLTLLLNTLWLAGGTCAISLPLGTALAWLLVRTDLPGRRLGMGLLALMLFVPLYVQTAAWQAGFGIQGWHTLAADAPAWLDGFRGAIWVHAMAAVPWVVLIVGVGLRLIEPELEEQTLLDGSSCQVFFRVTLRGALPAVGIAALWVAIVTASEITVTDLFVVRTFAEEIYTQSASGTGLLDAPLGLLPGLAMTGGLLLLGLLLCAKLMPHERPITLRRRRVFALGPWRVPAAVLLVLAMLLLVGVPLAGLLHKAGTRVAIVDGHWVRSWSVLEFLKTTAGSFVRFRREFGWSLGIGSLAALAAVAAGIGLAWFARRGGVRTLPALLIAAVCLAMPKPVVGLAIILLLSCPSVPLAAWLYSNSIFAPWLALFLFGLPPATLIMWHALRTLPQEMLDGAAADGAGSLAQLWRIALPCRLPALVLAWVVALAVALAELGASVLVVPPRVNTLSIRIFEMLHSGQEREVAGLSLALFALLTVVAAAAAWLVDRLRRMGRDRV